MSEDPIVRRIYPLITHCPHCKADRWRQAGQSGSIQYRRCLLCQASYKVLPIAIEIDRGLPSSVIVIPP